MKTAAIVLSLVFLAVRAPNGRAQTTRELNAQAVTMNNLAASTGERNVAAKISGDFGAFLGPDASAIVIGLRDGTPITLNTTTTTPGVPPTTTTNTTVITPPTGRMGLGNVFISLALAKQELAAQGITQPTAAQLQAALTGGTITQTTGTGGVATQTTSTLPGVLTLRSQNMGWGQIAHQLGFKIGPVIEDMRSVNHSLASVSTVTAGSAAVANRPSADSNIPRNSRSNGDLGDGTRTGISSSSGIVNAAGRGGNIYGIGQNSGIVTGAGHAAGGAVVSGGSSNNGNGQGKGHSK